MGLLTRLMGGENLLPGESKISIHDFAAAMGEYSRGSITSTQMATGFELNASEITALDEWLTIMDNASNAAAKLAIRQKMDDVLMLGEGGLYPIAKVKLELGITEA